MSSNYQLTCRDISIDGNVLTATCQRRDGSWNETSLVLKGIENIDGNLEVTDPNQDSSFDQTCENVSIDEDVITARCQTRDGSWNDSTSITLNGIENIDGELTYTGSP